MPASFLIAILGWFASHLVFFTLLGFVLVGIALFDGRFGVGTTSDRMVSPAPRAEREVPAADTGRESKPESTAASGIELGAQGRPSPQPKLIGGSLPVYEQGSGARPFEEPDRAREGFRPPESSSSVSVVPDRETMLQSARRAYWNGEFELAETEYVALLTVYPEDPDAFGELGNLYEAMGEWQLAQDAFFAAGERLKQRGEEEKLQHVIDLLDSKNDERAALLRQP